jgi:monofunctional biosynthetic peptidoglycan transglycosylase
MKALKRWLLWSVAAITGIVLLYHLWIVLLLWWWVDHNPSTSAFMEQRLEVIQEKKPDAKLKHQWVP